MAVGDGTAVAVAVAVGGGSRLGETVAGGGWVAVGRVVGDGDGCAVFITAVGDAAGVQDVRISTSMKIRVRYRIIT